jgi:hypothetical protein
VPTVKERPQALEVRHASRFAPCAGGFEPLLHGFDGYVVDVSILGEDVIGRIARVAEQVGNMAVGTPKRKCVNDSRLYLGVPVGFCDGRREVEAVNAAIRRDCMQQVFANLGRQCRNR